MNVDGEKQPKTPECAPALPGWVVLRREMGEGWWFPLGCDPSGQLSTQVIFQGDVDASAAGSELSLSNFSARKRPQNVLFLRDLLPVGSKPYFRQYPTAPRGWPRQGLTDVSFTEPGSFVSAEGRIRRELERAEPAVQADPPWRPDAFKQHAIEEI